MSNILLPISLFGVEADVPTVASPGDEARVAVAETEPFRPRVGSRAVPFLGKLWVIGGSPLPDVWVSGDGQRWELVTDAAPWTARSGHSIVYFKDRLWLIGGKDTKGNPLPDCWSTVDGVEWLKELAIPPALAEQAGTLSAVVFRGSLILIPQDQTYMWKSSDGLEWERHQGWTGRPAEDWRYQVFAGYLWCIGHLGVRKSEDGLVWENVERMPPWAYESLEKDLIFRTTIHRDRWWAAAALPEKKINFWSTTDGMDWRKEPSRPGPTPADFMLAPFDNSIWLLEGPGDPADRPVQRVQRYNETLGWRSFVDEPRWLAGNTQSAAVSFRGNLWRFGLGLEPQARHGNQAWTSNDGFDWQPIDPAPEWGRRRAHRIVATKGSLWLFGGEANGVNLTIMRDVWQSSDGRNWKQILAEAPWQNAATVVEWDSDFWLAESNGRLGFQMWKSQDGIDWEKVGSEVSLAWKPTDQTLQMKPWRDELIMWLSGGTNRLWRTDNGSNWEAITNPPQEVPPNGAIEVDGNSLWVVGGGGTDGQVSKAWYTSNLLDWKSVDLSRAYRQAGNGLQVTAHGGRIWIMDDSKVRLSWMSVVNSQ